MEWLLLDYLLSALARDKICEAGSTGGRGLEFVLIFIAGLQVIVRLDQFRSTNVIFVLVLVAFGTLLLQVAQAVVIAEALDLDFGQADRISAWVI